MNKIQIEKIKNDFPKGTLIKLLKMKDIHAPEPGSLGKVVKVDDIGTIFVLWQTGCCLGLRFDEDQFVIINYNK